MSNWIRCLDQANIKIKFPIQGDITWHNNPVNLDLCCSFNKTKYMEGYPSINFIYAKDDIRWIFDSEEDRNVCYNKINEFIFQEGPIF